MTSPPFQGRCSTSALVGPGVYVPVVVMVKVPVVWEVVPGRGLVAVAPGSACLLFFVGFSLVLQDLGNDPVVGFGGDEDLWEDQRARGSPSLFALVLSDSSRLSSGRRGSWWWW